jgi:riboflavin kinase/FMN adenylyltransferase
MGPAAVAIGNFDGVHMGHRHLLRATVQMAGELRVKPAVLTFDPHPAFVVAPERAPQLLTTIEERGALLGEEGIEGILILPFTREIARLSPEEFVSRILRDVLRAGAVVVGDNFRFGHKQAGDARMLTELGNRYGFQTRILHAVSWRGRAVSASAIRERIESGDVARAARLLERPYGLNGEVVRGHGVGSKQTVPTLNLRTSAQVLPARGVYVTRTASRDDGRRWNSITNVGYRPTFGGDTGLSIETFLLDPLSGAAPGHISVGFLRRIREERKFESPEALKAQIMRDVARAQAYFRRVSRWVRKPLR